MLKNSEKESRLYLCCCSHGSASAADFSAEITTLVWEFPLVAVEIMISPGEKKRQFWEKFPEWQREIPRVTQVLCVTLIINFIIINL